MISIVMTVRNDQDEANRTIKSIRDTAGDRVEIVVIDDGSDVPLVLDDQRVAFYRVHGRCGVGPARHLGATIASRPWLLIIDAHMRFEAGWLEIAEARLKEHDRTLFCGTCVGLDRGNMEMSRPNSVYSGAFIRFVGPDESTGKMQFLEAKWIRSAVADNEEIPCVLGACYFIQRSFFFQIGGLRMLTGWGNDEEFLSLKTWLAGGSVRLLKPVRIGHQFRTATTYTTKTAAILRNKLMIAATIFPQPAAERFADLMRLHTQPPGEIALAIQLAKNDQPQIECERAMYNAVFGRSFEGWLDRWTVPRFW